MFPSSQIMLPAFHYDNFGASKSALKGFNLDSDKIKQEENLLEQGIPKMRGAFVIDSTPFMRENKNSRGMLNNHLDKSSLWQSQMTELLRIEKEAVAEEQY